MTSSAHDYDLVVLGAGATGLGAARTARKAGRRVALVEPERPGGDCTHYGCVPSKSLLEAARRVQAARSGPQYGFRAEPEVDFAGVMERVQAVVAEIEQDESPALLAREGIDLLSGSGAFLGPHAVQVDGRTVTAERFVVATGSTATVPPIDGLDGVPHLTNRTVFGLREQPEHLLVLGGGADRRRAVAGVPAARLAGHGGRGRAGAAGQGRARGRRGRPGGAGARGRQRPHGREGGAGVRGPDAAPVGREQRDRLAPARRRRADARGPRRPRRGGACAGPTTGASPPTTTSGPPAPSGRPATAPRS